MDPNGALPEGEQFLAGKGAKLDVQSKAEGWTPLRIADGVYYANTVKCMPETATLLRQLLQARGIPVGEFKVDVDYGKAVQQPKP